MKTGCAHRFRAKSFVRLAVRFQRDDHCGARFKVVAARYQDSRPDHL